MLIRLSAIALMLMGAVFLIADVSATLGFAFVAIGVSLTAVLTTGPYRHRPLR
jgi:hypothetical protein